MPERYIVVVGVWELRNLAHHHRTLSEAFPGGIDTLVLFELPTYLEMDEDKIAIKKSPIYANLCAPLAGLVPRRVRLRTTYIRAPEAAPIQAILAPISLIDLRGIDLRSCRGLTDSDVLAICDACSNVEVASVSGCQHVHATGAAALMRLPKLHSLDLSWVELSGLTAGDVTHSMLRTLKVINCLRLETQPEWIGALRNLEAIEVWSGGAFYQQQWERVARVLAELPNLKTAVLRDWEASSLVIACAAPMLEVLFTDSSLGTASLLTSGDIAAILAVGSRIRFVCLDRHFSGHYVTAMPVIAASEMPVLRTRTQQTEIMIPATLTNLRQCGIVTEDDCEEPVDLGPNFRVELHNNISIRFATESVQRGPCPVLESADPLLDPIFLSVLDRAYSNVVGLRVERRSPIRRRKMLESVPKRKRKRKRITHK